MNERIKELAREAGLLVHNPEGVPTKLEKFAQLIVRECANWIMTTDSDPYIGKQDAKALLEHLGVEE